MNFQPPHLKIFLACLIVLYGVTSVTLHLHTIERTDQETGLSLRLGSFKEKFKTGGKPNDVKSEAAGSHPNVVGDISKENNSSAISNNNILNDVSPNNTPKVDKQDEFEKKKESNSTAAEILEFTHQKGGVIVTKVHGPHQLSLLKQSMCLLHQAYNNKVKYDIVVFTTIPIPETEPLMVDIRTMLAPTELKVVLDNDGIQNEISKLSPIRREKFLKRCKVASPQNITWDSECFEAGVGMGKLRYNWQAEFRSWHIWHHPSLKEYNYMMWIDTDAFCTQVWDRDPMAIAMKEKLNIYFDNYPQGRSKGTQPKVKEAFGSYLCGAHKTKHGPMYNSMSEDCGGSILWTIHGFYHITNLDFYRQPKVMKWAETMIGDCFLCRGVDDQLAVTVPAMVLEPEKAWDMYRSGFTPNIVHNHRIDGKRNKKAGGFRNYWKENGESQFPQAWDKCEIVEAS